MKRVVFLVRTPPYGSAAISESTRTCLGLSAMSFDLSYVLMDDATWAILPQQRPELIEGNDVLALITGLAELDVKLRVCSEGLAERGLSATDLRPEFSPVSREGIADLIAQADVVLTY
jgi:sulfur relay protein TusC/DsrF